MMNDKEQQNLADTITYPYDVLVESKFFDEDNWAARAALKKDQRYTLQEARKTVDDFKKEKVVG